ncbi:MAG: hypothetical protein AMXMBFR33_12080 [Candidatus Xenobia bacterium]
MTEHILHPSLCDSARLEALDRSRLMDSPPEPAFDRITQLIVRLLTVPVALVSLVDEQRQYFKSSCGLGEPWASRRQTPLSHSFLPTRCGTEPAPGHLRRTRPLVKANLAIPDLCVIA